jgi:hypothetical protein
MHDVESDGMVKDFGNWSFALERRCCLPLRGPVEALAFVLSCNLQQVGSRRSVVRQWRV